MKTVIVADFSPGLNIEDPVTSLRKNELSEAQEVLITGGGVGTRSGRTLLETSAEVATVHSMYEFTKLASSTKYQITGVGQKCYADTTEILAGLSGNRLSFATVADNLYIADGSGTIWEWTGTGSASVLLGAPTARFITDIASCLVCVGLTTAKNTAWWSDPNDATTWPVESQFTFSDNDPEGLTDAFPYFNQVAVTKKTKLYLVDGFPEVTSSYRVPVDVGNVAWQSRALSRKGPIFRGADGIYLLTDGIPQLISKKMQTRIDEANADRNHLISAAVFQDRYWLAYSPGSSTTEDGQLIVDLVSLGMSELASRAISSLFVFTNATSGKQELRSGGTNGQIFREHSGTTDNGTAFRSSIRLAPMVFSQEMTLLEAVLFFEAYSEYGVDLTVQVDLDRYASAPYSYATPGEVAVYDTAVYDSSRYSTGRIYRVAKRLGGRGKIFDFRIYTPGPSQPWRLHRVEAVFQPGGR